MTPFNTSFFDSQIVVNNGRFLDAAHWRLPIVTQKKRAFLKIGAKL